MLLWLVIAIGFVVCVVSWHLYQSITWDEATMVFIASVIMFIHLEDTIYKRVTDDEYIATGYVTSLIHRPAFTYKCRGTSTKICHEPERWIIEQQNHSTKEQQEVLRKIKEDIKERCVGECRTIYPVPFYTQSSPLLSTIEVSQEEFRQTKIGDPSSAWIEFTNPVKASDDVSYDGTNEKIPYFTIDGNNAKRLIYFANKATDEQINYLEKINAELSPTHISIGIIVTTDDLYFEKLKRVWYRGKPNDFVIVILSDGKTIRNVNILTWGNYDLQQKVISTIREFTDLDMDAILNAIHKTMVQNPNFVVDDFSQYNFLNIKIPKIYYENILIFQASFVAYMLLLLQLNPNSKDNKIPLSEFLKTWSRYYRPPSFRYYFHPATPPGVVLFYDYSLWSS